jgi:hypothetical protein
LAFSWLDGGSPSSRRQSNSSATRELYVEHFNRTVLRPSHAQE